MGKSSPKILCGRYNSLSGRVTLMSVWKKQVREHEAQPCPQPDQDVCHLAGALVHLAACSEYLVTLSYTLIHRPFPVKRHSMFAHKSQ